MEQTDTIRQVIRTIDELNQQDPNQVMHQGQLWSKEYLNSIYMTEQLQRYVPKPSIALQIACRAHHICRWQIARSDYPTGKAGYYEWRKSLYRHHSQITRSILEQHDVDPSLCDQVCAMIEKKNIRQDAETQCLVDVICHVFLLHYAESFSEKHEAAKIIDILEKTWKKLSDRGKTHVNELSISEAVSGFLSKAELS